MQILLPYIEKELLQRTSNGDEKAFTKLFHAYRNKIFTVAFKLTESEEMAEEIVQDVFLKIWTKRESLSEVEKFDSWLFIIARNTAYSALRSIASKKVNAQEAQNYFPYFTADTDSKILEKQYGEILKQAVTHLPSQQQLVYKLSREEGLHKEEIAQKLSIAPETVKKHLQYATRSIRAYCLSRMDLGLVLFLLWKNS